MISKLQAFYKSDAWEQFRKLVIAERTKPDGFIYDEVTGEPILKAYDLILHHKIELTEENVDDVSIALNPDNIMIVSFKTHNQLHKRFGYKPRKRVYIVYGSPCAGKSTWVAEQAEPNDIVLDIDKLWCAIRAPKCTEYEKPNALKKNIFALRDAMLEQIQIRLGAWDNAYIIGGYPLQPDRERTADRLGAERCIFIDTPKEVCLARAAERPSAWTQYVEDWFERYTPPSDRFT